MTEKYIPTVEEKDTYRARRDFLSISGDGIFATLQGEGVTAGHPAVFLRLQDCNLHCGKDGIHGTGRHLNFGKSAKIIHLMRLQKKFPLRGLRRLAVQKRNPGLSLLAENLYCSKTEL